MERNINTRSVGKGNILVYGIEMVIHCPVFGKEIIIVYGGSIGGKET